MDRTLEIKATLMRGGTSKGVFFSLLDLPADMRRDPVLRDSVLLRLIGSPDPYGKQIDGLGGATSSTSKVVLVSRSEREDCDVDYLFGQAGIEKPVIDWSGNCGNLTTAVGPFAIRRKFVDAPHDGWAKVRIWQANIGKRIIAYVPMRDGQVRESGTFELDGVPFPAGEIRLEFLDPGGDGSDAGGRIFPTGRNKEWLTVPGVGDVEVTLISAGNPTVFIDAKAFGLEGTEVQTAVNSDALLLGRLEAVRARAAVVMGLAKSFEEASSMRPATPKIAWVSSPKAYRTSSGRFVEATDCDLLVRMLSMGKLHHAITGTGAVAVAAAAAIPGNVVSDAIICPDKTSIRIGHLSGTLTIGSEVAAGKDDSEWLVRKVILSRTARFLMEGIVFCPAQPRT